MGKGMRVMIKLLVLIYWCLMKKRLFIMRFWVLGILGNMGLW